MQLSKRETQLIELFIKHGMTLTGQELAEFANISTKTVYRTIKKINEASDLGPLILAEVGKGFSLDYEKYLKESINKHVTNTPQGPLERRNAILLTLLFKSPRKVRMKDVFAPYFVSDTVRTNDLARMQTFLENYQLHMQKKAAYISVEGTEKNIRKAVNQLIRPNSLWEETFTTEKQKISSYDINFITSLVEFIEQQLENGLVYPYNTNIFSHIYILIMRVREGDIHEEEGMERLDSQEKELTQHYQELYQLSEHVLTKINQYLSIHLPESETFYLFQYLISSRIKNNHVRINHQSPEAIAITDFFARKMSQLMGMNIDQKNNRWDLYKHIEPLLYRLKNEIIVKNDLLSDIKLEYSEMFKFVKQVSTMAQKNYHLNSISDDEIGFLTLYFVRYQELHRKRKKVLIMCSSGVGTSELLKVKVKKAFPELEIVAVLSARMYQKAAQKFQDIDFILTTVHLNMMKNEQVPTLLVNAVFTKQDEKRVKELLGEM